MNEYLDIKEEVALALKEKKAIVCLESTIISHGMPYPQNYETALKCEAEIRALGAIPATIAIINGVIKVGLSDDEINYIAKMGKDVIKTSRRDLPYILATKQTGATTVSATMFIASLANIRVFATGGIGGVHRMATETFDISADLEELGQTNVCCVCAGAKAILDLPLTLEVLETKGVPVIGYQTDMLPAFYTKDSPYKVNFRLNTPAEIASLLKAKWSLNLNGGVLVCNPIPQEDSLDFAYMDTIITQAIAEMNSLKITGKDTTPFLLKRVSELTKGVSLASNISLVLNNCRLGANIAIELAKSA